MSFSADDHRYMARALQLAERGLYTTDPNPRVGCVLVRDNAIVGEGWHERAGEPHAEIHALKAAGDAARGSTAYVTLEPCCHQGRTPPCSDALIKAGVSRVVVAMRDPHSQVDGGGISQLQAAGISVDSGLMEAQAFQLNPGFIRRMQRGRPWVRLKLAMSLDGRTAMASGESQWITGAAARQDVQHWRARSSAILTGVGTVLGDDPSLTVRLEQTERQPLRVIVDTNLSTPASARILQQPGKTVIMTCSEDASAQEELRNAGAEVIAVSQNTHNNVDLAAVLDQLGELEINELHVETGATLAGALMQAGLVDELIIYMAPTLLGDAARGLFHLPGIETMDDRLPLQIKDIRAVGEDWRITAGLKKS
ncbi:MAG: bifunctional diaminohydroxyphosphoribosylaminopyrimidine deaminase/5-amino-6-(5-phosphoribosylamino)uracil reductase RibD [Thiohalophilus sp.]|uniref:bifunctional diaminohydroxyphosphoribosylaminopyrimidine deaminase/5-amino-6-(5-phosphoribosylamino)uracil reductase RibD n=1 Tax=Thiohalophilus sp. TaxID=3028392 RepID=UPI00286FBE8A|nr:bifunctional diaminohydroxyphosphoribosylaminopyrimidine deaminase/5-amino-6-(5-phosphoribosylamino)uracil reductase RibD [Thiohalophilus sp.]MDR9435697.1 bifunctional diaminohydroxyphosphoribosylaminopyrimidine deaminase/5-amino-6-(5-phosphoribosylamino)uracil reductase RibD [Thiohalophilus sp.]